MRENDITAALRANQPFADLPDISVESLSFENGPPDLMMTLNVAGREVVIYGELKNTCSPLAVAQIVPWLRQLKQARPSAGVALICPSLSPESQQICVENEVDFIDLAGNVSIRLPGIYIYRVGRKPATGTGVRVLRDPFSGRASRILRVLLEKPRSWRLVDIANELESESRRVLNQFDYKISLASISKAIKSLTEQLLVRRQDSAISVPEPKKLLLRWAEKYRERYRWGVRSSYKLQNPFGDNLADISKGLLNQAPVFAFTGVAVAIREAPYVDLSTIDVMVPLEASIKLRQIESAPPRGADLRIIIPYDPGVFMYQRKPDGIPLVSPVQVFLDLYARGGRDFKQAEYYLSTIIQPRWRNQ
jgi:hypothetical protein